MLYLIWSSAMHCMDNGLLSFMDDFQFSLRLTDASHDCIPSNVINCWRGARWCFPLNRPSPFSVSHWARPPPIRYRPWRSIWAFSAFQMYLGLLGLQNVKYSVLFNWYVKEWVQETCSVKCLNKVAMYCLHLEIINNVGFPTCVKLSRSTTSLEISCRQEVLNT